MKKTTHTLDTIGTELGDVKKRMNNVENRLDTVEDRLDVIDERLDGIDIRLDGIDERLDNLTVEVVSHAARFDQIDEKLAELPTLSQITTLFDNVMGKMQHIEVELVTLSSTSARHEIDIQKIKTHLQIA